MLALLLAGAGGGAGAAAAAAAAAGAGAGAGTGAAAAAAAGAAAGAGPYLPPEVRLVCGGNYGWNMSGDASTQGAACPTPTWEPVWALNLSTTPWCVLGELSPCAA